MKRAAMAVPALGAELGHIPVLIHIWGALHHRSAHFPQGKHNLQSPPTAVFATGCSRAGHQLSLLSLLLGLHHLMITFTLQDREIFASQYFGILTSEPQRSHRSDLKIKLKKKIFRSVTYGLQALESRSEGNLWQIREQDLGL